MLGQLLQPKHPIVYANTVEQLRIYADGLGLCLREQTAIQVMHEQGTYQLLLENTRGRSTRGELLLAGSERITWRVEQQGSYLQVAFIGLQPIFGQWHTRVTAEHWCVDMKISTTQQRPHEYLCIGMIETLIMSFLGDADYQSLIPVRGRIIRRYQAE